MVVGKIKQDIATGLQSHKLAKQVDASVQRACDYSVIEAAWQVWEGGDVDRDAVWEVVERDEGEPWEVDSIVEEAIC